MSKILGAIIATLGVIVATVPHLLLPMKMLKTATGAEIPTICFWKIHPELYIGTAIAIAGLALILTKHRRKRKTISIVVAILGILIIISAIKMRPFSYYIGAKHPIAIWAETSSIRSHIGIQPALLLSGALVVFSAFKAYIAKEEIFKPVERIKLLHLARQNIKLKLFRSIVILFGVGVVIGALFSGTLLTRSIEDSLEVGTARLGADLLVVPRGYEASTRTTLLSGEPSAFYMDRSIEQQVASIKGVKKTSSQIYIQPLPYIVCCTVENMLIVGYDPETDFTIAPWVEYSLGRPPTKYEMIVGNGVKFYPAQIVYFYGQEFSVSATLDSTGLAFFDNGAFITMDAAYEMATKSPEEAVEPLNISPNQISSVLVQLASFADPEEVIEEIESSIPEVGVVSVREATLAVKRQLFGLLQSLFIIIGLLWAMVVLMIGSIFSMSVNERQREIGLLRAMGATKGFVFKQIVLEATLLTTAGGILGVICGGVIILAFKNLIVASLKVHYIWLPPLLTVLLITACLVLAVLTGVIAALYPATMSSKLEPYAAIRRGE